jgi:uncharacterized protein YebE (UPF0316 family)
LADKYYLPTSATVWNVKLDWATNEIVVSTLNNLYIELLLKARTLANKINTVKIIVNVCGAETVTTNSNSIHEIILYQDPSFS